jgi:O-antigen ligase/tetratricopeptide (TPR) repeat protein
LYLHRVAGFLAFLLIPFLGGNHLSLYFVTIDRFWIETSFLLFLIVALLAHYLAGRKPNQQYLRFFLLILPLTAVCAGSLLYTWNSFSTLNELNVLVWSFGAVLLYLITDRRDWLQKALVVGSLLLVLSAVIQLKVLLPELARAFTDGKDAITVRDQVAPFGAFLNQNMLGGYFLYTLPLAFYFAVVEKKWIYVLAASVLILGILLSLSRLAMIIGFAGICIASALVARKFDSKWLWKPACAVGCAILLFVVLLHGERRETGSTMRSLLGAKIERGPTEITTLDRRTEVWGNGLKAFLAKPVFGHGAGTFEYAYRKFYDGGLYTKYAHSTIVKTGVELGALGLLCFLVYLVAFGKGIPHLFKDVGGKFLTLSALAGLLFGLLDFAFDMPAHVITFFVVSSVFLVPRNNPKPTPAARPLLLSVIVLLLFSFGFTARADLSRKSIEDGILYEEAGLYTDAYVSYRDAIQSMPLNNDGYTRVIAILMKSYSNEKNPQTKNKVLMALESYLRDLKQRTHGDAELYLVQGIGYGLRGKGPDACQYMMTAISLYPASAYYVFEAASCYARLGDFEEALTVAGRIKPYVASFKASGNPQGLFVYKIRDLEADIEYRRGNLEKAITLGRKNLASGRSEEYTICNSKAREFLSKEALIRYLMQKVQLYEDAVKGDRPRNEHAHGV